MTSIDAINPGPVIYSSSGISDSYGVGLQGELPASGFISGESVNPISLSAPGIFQGLSGDLTLGNYYMSPGASLSLSANYSASTDYSLSTSSGASSSLTCVSSHLTVCETYATFLPARITLTSGTSLSDTSVGNSFPTSSTATLTHMGTAFSFWNYGTTINGVTCILDSNGTTDAAGNLTLIAPDQTVHTLNASKPVDQSVTDAVMANDALAALKIAVGLSPNNDGSTASNYQLLAADVNSDGKITSSDALGILKMAVKLSTAPAQEWLFVSESIAGEEMSRTSVHRPSATTSMAVDMDKTVNLVGIVLGDVNGSWAA